MERFEKTNSSMKVSSLLFLSHPRVIHFAKNNACLCRSIMPHERQKHTKLSSTISHNSSGNSLIVSQSEALMNHTSIIQLIQFWWVAAIQTVTHTISLIALSFSFHVSTASMSSFRSNVIAQGVNFVATLRTYFILFLCSNLNRTHY